MKNAFSVLFLFLVSLRHTKGDKPFDCPLCLSVRLPIEKSLFDAGQFFDQFDFFRIVRFMVFIEVIMEPNIGVCGILFD